MALQHLRSSTANKRPTPGSMSDGQLALNTNVASPGAFFKDSTGALVKAGPVHVGTTAPNASPAGSSGNSIGEQWLDTSASPAQLKVWNGTAWVSALPDELPVSKLADGSARQLLQTDAAGTGVEWTSNVDVPGTLDVTSTATFDSIASHPLGSAGAPTITFTGDTNTGIYSPGADQVAISTNGTERTKIDNEGRLQTFTSGNSAASFASSSAAGTTNYLIAGNYGATAVAGGTNSFRVYTNGNVENTNNSYGAISDIKLKENIVDASSQWDDIKALRPVNYNFKEGQTHTQLGLIAQEVELVSPGLVSESPDRDEDGNDLGTVTKSVNYSVLYMKAVKALQEAMERIETLEASNTDLLARVSALESA